MRYPAETRAETIQKIDEATDILRRLGGIFYQWYGLDFEIRNDYTKLDKVFLYLFSVTDGEPVIRRLVGIPRNDRLVREPYILYTTCRDYYRIRTGERKGQLMFLEDIRPDETFNLAGLHKYLKAGDTPECVNPDPDNGPDQPLRIAIHEFVDAFNSREVAETPFQFPEFILISDDSNRQLFPRHMQETLQYLQNLKSFDRSKPAFVAYQACLRELGKPAGPGKLALPYRHIHGKAIRAADRSLFRRWFHVPGPILEKYPEVEFELKC